MATEPHEGFQPLALSARGAVQRVALISVHTCPLDQPGTGDSGGMNVYIRQAARRLAEMGVEVDIFSRWAGASKRVRSMYPGVRVIHLEAGPRHPIPKEALPDHLCEFVSALVRFDAREAERLGVDTPIYDAVHSHYWLSGSIGRHVAERWQVPLIHSFHTLGRVKNLTLADGDRPEPSSRIAAEERVVATADRILAPTQQEAAELVSLYHADPARVRVVAPGVDTDVFKPGDRLAAKEALGLQGRTVVLFVGRLQPLKAPDTAVRAVARLAEIHPELDPVLVVLGGPSGRSGVEPVRLEKLAANLGAGDRLVMHEPVPHGSLPRYYRAADAVLITSRTESFGLVALEAAACGTPVVATDVGGLRTTVRDGVSGALVPSHHPDAYANALSSILLEPDRARALGDGAAHFAKRYDWRVAAAGLLAVYEEPDRNGS